jgi:chromosome segregation ATPase
MSEQNEQQGGTEWEAREALVEAENALIAAGIDPAAYLRAARRHTESIRNYMQTALVPSFENAIGSLLSKKIDPVAEAINGLRTDVQQSAAEEAARLGELEARVDLIDARHDELDSMQERLTKVEERQAAAAAADRDDIRVAIRNIEARQERYEQEHQELLARLERRGDGQ